MAKSKIDWATFAGGFDGDPKTGYLKDLTGDTGGWMIVADTKSIQVLRLAVGEYDSRFDEDGGWIMSVESQEEAEAVAALFTSKNIENFVTKWMKFERVDG